MITTAIALAIAITLRSQSQNTQNTKHGKQSHSTLAITSAMKKYNCNRKLQNHKIRNHRSQSQTTDCDRNRNQLQSRKYKFKTTTTTSIPVPNPNPKPQSQFQSKSRIATSHLNERRVDGGQRHEVLEVVLGHPHLAPGGVGGGVHP